MTYKKQKAALRKRFQEIRNKISVDDRQRWNREAYELVTASDLYRTANSIFIFVSIRSEIDTHNIIRTAIQQGKKVFVPRTTRIKGKMEAVAIDSLDQLKPATMGLLEPDVHFPPEASASFDLIIVPGLAFDLNGNRLGYGGGYYDRFLANKPEHGLSVGLCYHTQVTEQLPVQTHDQKLDGIISERKIVII